MSRKPTRRTPGQPAKSKERPAKKAEAEKKVEAESTAASELDSDSLASVESPPRVEDPATETDGTPQGKTTLPAFGFASDLLPKTGSETEDPPEQTSASTSLPESASSPEAVAEGVEDVTPDRSGSETPPPADRIFRFADSLAQEIEEERERVVQRITTWVAFELSGEVFAMPVEPVREVLRVSGITRVPHAPKPIRGVTNLRGRVIPVIDLRQRIELQPTPISRATRIIVVSSRNRLLGLLVDAVQQVIHLDLNRVQSPPEDVMTLQSDYISGVYHLEDKLILLLDVDRALIVRESSLGDSRNRGSGVA